MTAVAQTAPTHHSLLITHHYSPDLARAAAIFLVVFAVYFVGYSRTLPPTADEMVNFSLAQSIAKWQSVAIDQVSTVGPNPEEFGADDHRYGKYGPLQAVLSVPLFLLAQRLPIGAVDTVLLLNHLLTAFTAAVYFLLVRRMGYRAWVAVTLVAVAVFGTPLWVHSKRYFGEPSITLCLVATIYAAYAAATTGRRRWLVATGLAFGLSMSAKYVDALLLIPVPLYLGWVVGRRGERVRVRGVPFLSVWFWFGIGALPIVALLGWYDVARFGDPLFSGYARWEGFSTPFWVGLAGFLFSPGKSIFVYTPLFLLLPFWAPSFIRRFPSFGALLGTVVVLHLLLYGAWWVWWGAWAWGPRFIVPILPLLVLFLAEGLATIRRPVVRALAIALGALGVVIQILGLSVDHTVYLVQLLPLNSKPDTLTLYNVRYSPILHQIPLMTRQWLDFAWIQRTGPSPIDAVPLAAALIGVVGAVLGFVVVWRSSSASRWVPALLLACALVGGGTLQALRVYDRQIDLPMASLSAAFLAAPPDTGIVQLIPSAVIPFANWQKRDLPELGWIEETRPSPLIDRRVNRLEKTSNWIWLATEAPPKSPSNGVEAMLDRSLVLFGEEAIGPFRLLRYAVHPESLRFTPQSFTFADGIQLTGFAAPDRPSTADRVLNVVLAWRADPKVTTRPDYTVFVHLVASDGSLIAQHDDPPASGYAPTSSWQPGQTTYDDHAIALPSNAPAGLHLVQVGLYRPSTGQRAPLLGLDGKPSGDTVTLDLG